MFRVIALMLLVALAANAPAGAQQPHWLVGTWKGALGNLPSTNRFGPDRTLEVKTVAPNGSTAQGRWIAQTGTQTVAITISGNEISFATAGSSGATYKMTHNAGTLTGSWAAVGGGGGGTITLKKQ